MTAFSVKSVLLGLVLWQIGGHATQAPVASQQHLRFKRVVMVATSEGAGQACAVLDAQVFAHALPSLKDLRLYAGKTEVPYATTLSEPLQQESEDARILNLGARGGRIVFDLEMPHRPYTNVSLDLGARDFIATATVSGGDAVDLMPATEMGSFTLFDLTGQHLSHSTSLPLQESSFRYLHIELAVRPAPGSGADLRGLNDPAIVKSATVPPSREAQTVYTTVAQSSTLVQRGRQSVASFQVPMRVPVERISFVVEPSFKGNFSREVTITARASSERKTEASGERLADVEDDGQSGSRDETLAGTISRVHKNESGRELSQESLSITSAIGSNMQRPAAIEVAIDNGDDAPLPIAAVRLEMRQRRICFDTAAATVAPLMLYYGDAELEAPVYDYAKLFQPVAKPMAAELGSESLNAGFEPRLDKRPFTERHPELLWIGLLGVVCILAVTAFRSAKKLH